MALMRRIFWFSLVLKEKQENIAGRPPAAPERHELLQQTLNTHRRFLRPCHCHRHPPPHPPHTHTQPSCPLCLRQTRPHCRLHFAVYVTALKHSDPQNREEKVFKLEDKFQRQCFGTFPFWSRNTKVLSKKTKGQSNPAARIKFAAASESLETNQFISDTLLLRYQLLFITNQNTYYQ